MEVSGLLSGVIPLLLAGLNVTSNGGGPPPDPAIYHTTPDVCREIGVKCALHSAETEDGYLVTAYHVAVPPGVPRRGALLAVSGIIGCSDSFLLYPPDNMPQTMVNAGYDVVLANLRGSVYARGHRRWAPEQREYWRFTMDDMGEYDMEALVALTRRVTGDPRPFFLGYSAGAGVLYTWLRRRPRAAHVLRGAVLWAPSVFYAEPHSPSTAALSLLPQPVIRALWQSPADLLPRSLFTEQLAWPVCRPGGRLRRFCEGVCSSVYAIPLHPEVLSRLHVIVAHTSCGVSSAVFAHWVQNIRTKRLQAFDFGRAQNLARYGSAQPPAYSLNATATLPTAFFLGTRDRVVSFQEAMRQLERTPRHPQGLVEVLDGYDHLHFMFDRDIGQRVFQRMLAFMSQL